MVSIKRSKFEYDMALVFAGTLMGGVFGTWSYFFQKWLDNRFPPNPQALDYTVVIETIVALVLFSVVYYQIRHALKFQIVPNGEEKGLASSEETKIEKQVEEKLRIMASDFASRGYDVGKSLEDVDFQVASVLSAYANFIASKRIENITTSLGNWNKVYILATIFLGAIAIFVRVL